MHRPLKLANQLLSEKLEMELWLITHIPVSVWGKDIIQQSDEDKPYMFKSLNVQNY